MIGFTGMFVKQARKYADQYTFSGATELAPLLTQAFSEVASTLPRIQRVSQASDGIVEGSFQLERAGQLVNKGSNARTVLAALDGDAAKRFREMLLPPPGGRGGMLFRLYGQSADIAPIQACCERHGVKLIEDAAEALGATYGERCPGSLGWAGIHSFNGNKIITTSGGGMLVTADPAAAAQARFLAAQARQARQGQGQDGAGLARFDQFGVGAGTADDLRLADHAARRR